MKIEQLTEIAPIINERVISFDGGKPYLSTGGLDGNKYETVDVKFNNRPSRADLTLLPNDVFMARMQYTPKIFQATEEESDLIISTGFVVFRPIEGRLFPRYLYHYLKSNKLQFEKNKRCSGATQKAINNSKINELEIPVPSYGDQTRIAEILDNADALRQKRKESIKLLDDFLRSTFLDMFGDSFLNDKNWPTINLKDSCLEVVDCPHSTPKYSGVNEIYPCIRTTEIRDGHLDWSSMKYVDELQYTERIKRLKPLPGDIIYGREGSFGDAIVIPKNEKMCLGQRVMLFRPNPEIYHNLFFWCLIRSKGIFHMALQKNNGATVGHVNVGDIKLFSLIKPPIELQIKFADIVKQVEKLKAKYKESEKELNNLFGSLMQRAFKGEL